MAISTRRNNGRYFEEAPTQYLAFPQNEPITAVEVLVFDPNKLRSYDTNFRLHSNGVTNQVVKTIMNYHRDEMDKGEVEANNLLKIMQKSMRDRRLHQYPAMKKVDGETNQVDEQWTSKLHKKFNTKDHYGPWDPNNLECTGYTPDLGNENLVPNVRFNSLAKDVKRYPSIAHGDGLNLTRCVQYAVAHPEEDWMYPRDVTTLTDKLGRLPVQPHHVDTAVFDRFKNRQTPNPPARLIPSSRAAAAQRAAAATIPPAAVTLTQAAPIQPAPLQAPPAQPAASQLPPLHFWPPPQPLHRQGAPLTIQNHAASTQTAPSPLAPSRPSTRALAAPTVSRPRNNGIKKSNKSQAKMARSNNDARVAQLQRNSTQFVGSFEALDFVQYVPGHEAALLDQAPGLLYNHGPGLHADLPYPAHPQSFGYTPGYTRYGDTIMGDATFDSALLGESDGFKTPTPSDIDQVYNDWESGFIQSSPYANNNWVPTGSQVAFPPSPPVGAFLDLPGIAPMEQYEWSCGDQSQLDPYFEQGSFGEDNYEDPTLASDNHGAYFPSNFHW
jgi:hypothetical protein